MSEHSLLSIEEQEELKRAIAEAEAEDRDEEAEPKEEPKPEPKAEPKAEEKPETAEEAKTEEDAPLPQLEEEDAAPVRSVQMLAADDTAEAEKEIAQIKAYRADLHKKFSDGEIESGEYANKLDEANDRLVELKASIQNAEMAARTNLASTQQLWMDTVEDYRSQYKELQTKSVNAAWDFHIKAMREDATVKDMLSRGEPAGKVFRYVLKEAHKTVRAELNLGGKPAEVRETAPPPKSLSGLPQATPANVNADEFAAIDALTGEDAEIALARLSPEKRERYLMRA